MKRLSCTTLPYSRLALVLALSIFYVVLLASPASAQEEAEAVSAPPEAAAPAPVESAPPTESAPEVAAPEEAAPTEAAPADAVPTDARMPWEKAESADEAAPEAEAAAEEAPAEAVAEVPAPAPDAETPAKPEKVKKVKEPKKPKEPKAPKEPSDGGGFRLGLRAALGAGGFHGHKALKDERYEGRAIVMQPSVSASAGLAGAFVLSDVFSLAIEAQYSLYKAHGEFVVPEEEWQDYRDLYLADATLHAAELPIIARFHVNPLYIEAGVSPGVNVYSRIYKGIVPYKPIPNYFACGAVLGFGLEFDNVLVGVRGQYGFMEYDKNLTGLPWSAQVSLTKFFLN